MTYQKRKEDRTMPTEEKELSSCPSGGNCSYMVETRKDLEAAQQAFTYHLELIQEKIDHKFDTLDMRFDGLEKRIVELDASNEKFKNEIKDDVKTINKKIEEVKQYSDSQDRALKEDIKVMLENDKNKNFRNKFEKFTSWFLYAVLGVFVTVGIGAVVKTIFHIG